MNLSTWTESREVRRFLIIMLLGALTSCSSGPKRSTPKLSEMVGKKVALVEIDAEPSTRLSVEVSLVNELISRGSFVLINKADLEKAKQDPTLHPTDTAALGRKVGADYTLKTKVLAYSADETAGYVKVRVEDSQLAAEQGEKARWTEKPVKAKSLVGTVHLEMEFTDLAKLEKDPADAVKSGPAVAMERIDATEEKGAIKLPPKMSFLDKLTRQAVRKFFEEFQD